MPISALFTSPSSRGFSFTAGGFFFVSATIRFTNLPRIGMVRMGLPALASFADSVHWSRAP